MSGEQQQQHQAPLASANVSTSSLLHEQVLRDQKTFEAKIARLNKRKQWLRSNELLLRTFLSYCSLHSATGGGLSSVKMELMLLMQELAEDRSMRQLLSPVPAPTTIPLLSASIATSKNVVAGPIQMRKSFVNDILSSLAQMRTQQQQRDASSVPSVLDYSLVICTVKELAVSLSSCIYQCLCDSDALVVSDATDAVTTGMQGFSRNILYKSSSYLMSGTKRHNQHHHRTHTDSNATATATAIKTLPATQQQQDNNNNGGNKSNNNGGNKSNKVHSSAKNWPGVSSLTKLLEREQDIEAPKLKILLFESLVSVFASLFLNSFIFYDCSTLWRLLSNEWNDRMWSRLFGGGCLTEYKYRTQTHAKVSIGVFLFSRVFYSFLFVSFSSC